MPPKRSGTSEASSTPEPKKRMTRSSTRATEAETQDSTASSPKEAQKEPQRTSRAKKPSIEDAKSGTNSSNTQSTPKSDIAPPSMTTTSFTHALVKNPIECHEYTPNTSKAALPTAWPPMLIFTHGAGGTLSSPTVANFCNGFATTYAVSAFQGSMSLKARTKGFHACIEKLDTRGKQTKDEDQEKRLLLGGRSMGARAAVIAANEYLAQQQDEKHELAQKWPTARLILVSYPLLGPKNELRDQILLDLPQDVDVLFIVGDKDAMCPLDLLDETRKRMKARSQLVTVKDADHGMHVKGGMGREKEIGEETGRVAARWVDGKLKTTKDGETAVSDEETV